MRSWVLGLAVVVLSASAAAADEKAEAVVKKAIDANGGADALNKYVAGKLKMKGEFSVMNMDFEFTGTLQYSGADRMKLEVNSDIMGMKLLINQVVKGDSVKHSVTVGGMTIPGTDGEKAELKAEAALREAEQLTPLLDAKKFTLKSADDETVNDKKCAVIVAKPKAVDKELKMYFDKESWLVVKTQHKAMGPGEGGAPQEVNQESYYSEYKKVSGIQVSHKQVVMHDSKKFMTVEVTEVELLEKIDDKEFAIDD